MKNKPVIMFCGFKLDGVVESSIPGGPVNIMLEAGTIERITPDTHGDLMIIQFDGTRYITHGAIRFGDVD